jgi:hypothetical protein
MMISFYQCDTLIYHQLPQRCAGALSGQRIITFSAFELEASFVIRHYVGYR